MAETFAKNQSNATDSASNTDEHPLAGQLRLRRYLPTFGYSFLINLLYLTGPIFMMQVYDRVLASSNIPTLIALLFVVLVLYIFFGVLEYIRTQILMANGEAIVARLAEPAYKTSVLARTQAKPQEAQLNALEDVHTLRTFLCSPAFGALFDLPWSPLFLLFVFSLHPQLGLLAVLATVGLAVLAIVNERLSRKSIQNANSISMAARHQAETAQRNATALIGNGMLLGFGYRWRKTDYDAQQKGVAASAVNSGFSTLTKTVRLAIQSCMLGAGAYFVVQGEMTAGAIIAGSVTFGRALAPLEALLGNISLVINGQRSWREISTWVMSSTAEAEKEPLPKPQQKLTVNQLSVIAPGSQKVLVKNVHFELGAGEVLAISGPSGCGKSSLAKALTGAWPQVTGKICLDGAELSQYSREFLGVNMGYVPQTVELFEGTVAENIARFQAEYDFNAVLTASRLAGIHEMILALPEGYDTRLGGTCGMELSGGQRQRVALARALYGLPFLLVLDEPNSNLDKVGEQALIRALTALKRQGCITVLIAHRPNVLSVADKILVMADGEMKAFGAPQDIMKAAQKKQPGQQQKAKAAQAALNKLDATAQTPVTRKQEVAVSKTQVVVPTSYGKF